MNLADFEAWMGRYYPQDAVDAAGFVQAHHKWIEKKYQEFLATSTEESRVPMDEFWDHL